MIVAYLTIFSAIIIGLSIMILKYFPTSKVSGFIRLYLITDEDLEPINDEGSEPLEGNESQSPSEGTNS
jgi:hypothetical protein